MKKEVQALLHRRRARVVPAILAILAGLLLCAVVVLVVSMFTGGPVAQLFRTATPTPSITPTATATPSDTPTAQFTDTPTATPGPSPTPAPITYTVAEGDTLYDISVQYNVSLCELMAANQITNPSLVSVGQVLTVPLGGLELPTATALPADIGPGSLIRVAVQCGDSLQSIAAQFNSTVDDIVRRNKISDPNNIGPGTILIVRIGLVTPTPAGTSTVTPRESPTPTA
jgi:LysM repeat protein